MATTQTITTVNNEGRLNYPFVDTASLKSREGFTLPAEIIQDACIYPIGGGIKQHISRISVEGSSWIVEISDTANVVGIGTYNGASAQVIIKDTFGREIGVLYGNLNLLSGFMPEVDELRFRSSATEFVPSVVMPQPQSMISGLLTLDDELLSDTVWLIGEDGVVLEVVDSTTVKINAIGDKLYVRRLCEGEQGDYTTPRPLKKLEMWSDATKLGDFAADSQGNVFLVPGNGDLPSSGTGVNKNIIRINSLESGGIQLSVLGNFE